VTAAPHALPPSGVRAYVQRYLAGSGVDATSRRQARYIARTIAIGGGRSEIVVYIVSPDVCGSGGCTVLVLVPHGRSYATIGEISVSRPPIEVLSTRHHGRPDLAVFVAGGGILPGYEAIVPFDGTQYAENPTIPPASRLRGPQGRVLIGPDDTGAPVY